VATYLGTYPRALDSKNRVQLPAKWKKDLPEDLVLVPYNARDTYRSVRVFSEEGFAAFMDSIFASEGGFDQANPDHVDRRAHYSMEARQAQQDSTGRIVIPSDLRSFANLDRDVIVAGEWDCVSLWNQDAHGLYMKHAKGKTAS
jgi:MraZ protein